MMSYKVLDVCRFVINYSNEHDYGISNLKLQKVLYFIQAYFLTKKKDHSTCFDEKIEAWDFGPVVPEVYHRYKAYGSASIPYMSNSKIKEISEDDKKLIDGIVDECSQYSAAALVEITHNQAPWLDVYKPYCNNTISKRSIKKYFAED